MSKVFESQIRFVDPNPVYEEQYKREYKAGLIDMDLKFYSIDHDKISVDEEAGFEKWNERLEGYLV